MTLPAGLRRWQREALETYEATFDEEGAYAYYCSLHGNATDGMVGTVLVGDVGEEALLAVDETGELFGHAADGASEVGQFVAATAHLTARTIAAARKVLADLKSDASHPDVLALQAAILTKEGRYDEARALLNKVAATGWNSRTMAEARLALVQNEPRNIGALRQPDFKEAVRRAHQGS